MKKKKNILAGKFIIAFDTICDGYTATKDEKGKPVLFNSFEEAQKEIFEDALSILGNYDKAERKENNISEKQFKEMEKVSERGNVKEMEKFLDKNPDCNLYQEFITPAEEYIEGRKAIFGAEGLQIVGTPAKELF